MNKAFAIIYEQFLKHPVISTDSRNITQNCIFFALKGDNFNGNEFAENALCRGASLAVIDDIKYKKSDCCVVVDDVLNTLQQLSLWHRKTINIPIIGITGSNGKTTTKELINAVLSTQFNCLATKGNLNNHIGVPLTLLSLTKQTDIAIVEMGANHINEIEELCHLALPTYGIITNIGKAHLEGFISIENIIKTKTALYRSVKKSGVCVFVNADDTLLMEQSEKMNIITYSSKGLGEHNAELVSAEPFLSLRWNNKLINTKLFGTYNVYNILAAVTIGKYFGITDDNIVMAISSYTPVNNRSQILKTEKNTLILDAYNANPTSIEAALISFAGLKDNNKLAILGDMLELGVEKENEHLKIISLLKKLGLVNVMLVGEIFQSINEGNFNTFRNAAQLKDFLTENPPINKTILIKGSRGIKLELIIPSL